MRNNKKAVSAIVATVLLILITVAAVGIIWGAIMPMLNKATELGQACMQARLTIDTTSGYTCYDESKKQASVMITRGAEEFELAGMQVGLSSGGTLTSYNVRPNVSGGSGGIDSYAKLLLHMDGSAGSTTFTDSSLSPKTVTNAESHDSYTKLMLHMDGANGSTTFLDSETIPKTVTANGQSYTDTRQSKFGGAGGFFDGTGDYLTTPDSDDWAFGTGAFTVDAWVRFNAYSSSDTYYLYAQQPDATHMVRMYFTQGDIYWYAYVSTGDETSIRAAGSFTPTLNTWYHIVVVRETGNTWYIFVDGVSKTLIKSNGDKAMPDIAGALEIGRNGAGASALFNGWLDEFRISKGIARWTANFTVPASPYGKVYTVTGTKKFGTASAEFHGSGDYLSLADNADWDFGTGDFTLDVWVRFNVVGSALLAGSMDDGDNTWRFASGDRISFYAKTSGAVSTNYYSDVLSWSANTWYHVAFVRSGSTAYIFRDGISLSVTESTPWGTLPTPVSRLGIGAIITPGIESSLFNGWLDELRVSKGTARWTGNFNVPSSAYTSISIIQLPQQNEAKTFTFDATDITEASVAPVVRVGNSEKVCGISSKVQVPKCAV